MFTLQQTIGGGGTLGQTTVFISSEVARIQARAYVRIVFVRRWLRLARLATAYQSQCSAHKDTGYLYKMASRELSRNFKTDKLTISVWITYLLRHLVSKTLVFHEKLLFIMRITLNKEFSPQEKYFALSAREWQTF